jgi:2-iminobutanoate/2-iminopropanoate deaminase
MAHRTRTEIRAPELAEPLGHYADAVEAGGFLFVSGCVPLDASGELVGGNDATEQARAALTNLGHVLRSAGAGFGDVVKLFIFLTDMADRPAMTPVRREFFGETRPASTLVGVNALAVAGMRVEIDATALLPARPEAGG